MTYPILLLRIKAILIDSITLVLIYFSMVLLCINFGIASSELKAFIILAPTVLFEPIMIWQTGGSLGHHYAGIKIVDEETGNNLPIYRGLVRFIAKSFLGIFSFLTMSITKKNRAIHDIASGSLVVFKDEAAAPSHHKMPPRLMDYVDKKPSIGRRLAVSVIYSLLLYFILSIAMYALTSSSCMEHNKCTEADNNRIAYLSFTFLALLVMTFILGFMCKLPGAHYRAKNST